MLEEHLDAGGAASRQAVAESAGGDDVVAQVLLVEQAGVALEGAVGGDGLEGEGGEFQLGGGEWGTGAHGCAERGRSPRLLKWCESQVERALAVRVTRRRTVERQKVRVASW